MQSICLIFVLESLGVHCLELNTGFLASWVRSGCGGNYPEFTVLCTVLLVLTCSIYGNHLQYSNRQGICADMRRITIRKKNV